MSSSTLLLIHNERFLATVSKLFGLLNDSMITNSEDPNMMPHNIWVFNVCLCLIFGHLTIDIHGFQSSSFGVLAPFANSVELSQTTDQGLHGLH